MYYTQNLSKVRTVIYLNRYSQIVLFLFLIHCIYIDHKTNNPICSVPINIDDKEDIGHATYNAEIKAISIMRYINKAKKNESLAFYGEFIDSGNLQE